MVSIMHNAVNGRPREGSISCRKRRWSAFFALGTLLAFSSSSQSAGQSDVAADSLISDIQAAWRSSSVESIEATWTSTLVQTETYRRRNVSRLIDKHSELQMQITGSLRLVNEHKLILKGNQARYEERGQSPGLIGTNEVIHREKIVILDPTTDRYFEFLDIAFPAPQNHRRQLTVLEQSSLNSFSAYTNRAFFQWVRPDENQLLETSAQRTGAGQIRLIRSYKSPNGGINPQRETILGLSPDYIMVSEAQPIPDDGMITTSVEVKKAFGRNVVDEWTVEVSHDQRLMSTDVCKVSSLTFPKNIPPSAFEFAVPAGTVICDDSGNELELSVRDLEGRWRAVPESDVTRLTYEQLVDAQSHLPDARPHRVARNRSMLQVVCAFTLVGLAGIVFGLRVFRNRSK